MIFETIWGAVISLPLWFILPVGMEDGPSNAIQAASTLTQNHFREVTSGPVSGTGIPS